MPTIGVLLPVRLETLFEQPDGPGTNYVLRVLIVPDTIHIDSFEPGVTLFELDALEVLWRTSKGNLWTEEGKRAFQLMSQQFTPARTLYLARTFPPLRNGVGEIIEDANGHVLENWDSATAQIRASAKTSVIAGLPPTIEIWMGRNGNPPVRLDPPLTVDPEKLKFKLGDKSFSPLADNAGLRATFTLEMTTESELADIDVILALGVGEEAPNELLNHHRDSGALALVASGTPTNTLGGAPAISLARDPEVWRRIWLGNASTGPSGDLGWALTGDRNSIGLVPDDSGSPRRLNSALVRALWYPLWGHALKDIWNYDADSVSALALWSADHLFPEGPLPPIRINDQPYGVLPTTSLERWQVGANDPPIEASMRAFLLRLRTDFARRAISHGTVFGADTERLLDLLSHMPVSSGYAYRKFAPLEIVYLTLRSIQQLRGEQPLPYTDFLRAWEKINQVSLEAFQPSPIRRYLTQGFPQDLNLPLVNPTEPASEQEAEIVANGELLFFYWLKQLYERGEFGSLYAMSFGRELFHPNPPNSLLLRLILNGLINAHAELARWYAGVSGPRLEPFYRADGFETELHKWNQADPYLTLRDILARNVPANLLDTPPFTLYFNALSAIESLFSWDVALIERVFRATLDTASHRVDPWITGIAWRRLNALRDVGASTGLGLYGWVDSPARGKPGPTRGGVIHSPSDAQTRASVILRDHAINDLDPARWKMNLDSDLVRRANQFANQVRAGDHIQQVLGREVERIVAQRETIKKLRDNFPVRTEHAGRRVCDGQKVLAQTDNALRALGVTDANLLEFSTLRRVIDAYGDLLIADGVYHLVSNRPEAAGEAMEAAAGLALPPTLEVLRTPLSGRAVNTVVLATLPFVAPPPSTEPGVSAGELAEPSFAAYLAQSVAPQAWIWRKVDETPFTLVDLGLAPVDTLALSADALNDRAQQIAGGTLRDETASQIHQRAKRLAAVFGGVPAQLDDVQLSAPTLPNNADALSSVRERYTAVYEAAKKLVDALQNAADDAARTAALSAAARWGIVPSLREEETLADLVTRAHEILTDRLATAPAVAPPPSPADALSLRQLATALSELASPGGHLPILSRMARADLDAAMPFEDEAQIQRTQLQAANNLDSVWLEVVAPVRPILTRLESFQLEATMMNRAPLNPFTNRPEDPWQQNALPRAHTIPRPGTLVVTYEGLGALTNAHAMLAVTILDSWSETVPDENHTTSVGFGFNAPGSRPPQAILIAVPPDENQQLDTDTLAQIVMETRELARARMVTPQDLGDLAGFLPLAMVPTREPTEVHFDWVKE